MSSPAAATMYTAFGFRQYGGPEVLLEEKIEKPTPQGRDLLVKIYAGAVNPVDTKVMAGGKGGDLAALRVTGYDGAGVVEAVGSDVTSFKVGDAVYFAGLISRNGTFAEYTLVDERIVAAKPKSLNWAQAASVPLVALTAWEGLVEELRIPVPHSPEEEKRNQSKKLLFIGGAGGVGSIGLQLAKKVLKLTVIATASRPETIQYCKDLGADYVIGHGVQKPFAEELKALGISGVDYVFNTDHPTQRFDLIADIMNPLGAIVNIQHTGGEKIDVGKLMNKRVSLHYEFMFARPMWNAEPEAQQRTLTLMAQLLDSHVIHHTLRTSYRFTLADLKQALTAQKSGKCLGKLGFSVINA